MTRAGADQGRSRVWCVIVTYNRLAMLQKAVHAVLDQVRKPDVTLVVDNNSSDGTREWLMKEAASKPDLEFLPLDENYGGAGGFHYGIKRAYEAGADWIWVMDDDCIPSPHALAILVDSAETLYEDAAEEIGFLASRVNWIDDTPHKANYPTAAPDWINSHPKIEFSVKIERATFVSILINRCAIERVGLPIFDFFIWWDDIEFTKRITRAGFSAYYIPSSLVHHATESNNPGADAFEVTRDNLWKFKLLARNRVAYERSLGFGLLRGCRELAWICWKLHEKKLSWRLRVPIISSGIRGFVFNVKRRIVFP